MCPIQQGDTDGPIRDWDSSSAKAGFGFSAVCAVSAVAFWAQGRPQAPPASLKGVGELEMDLTRAAELPLESHKVCPKGAQKPVCRPGKMIIN